MRVYVLTCVLLICACVSFDGNVHAMKWTFEKTSIQLAQSMHLTLKGRDICDDKIFSLWKRKKLCEIASNGKQKLFDKKNLQKANDEAYKCEDRIVLFLNVQPDPRRYSMFRCPTDVGEYYLGRGRNDNEVAVYVPVTGNDTQSKSEPRTSDKGGVEPGQDETPAKNNDGVWRHEDEPSSVVDENDALVRVRSKEKRSVDKSNSKRPTEDDEDDNKESKREPPAVSEEIELREELEKVLPSVQFYGIMKGVDLQTLGRFGAKLKVNFNKYVFGY